MAYNKRVWANGDLITKEKINHMEDGIYDAHDKINAIDNEVKKNTDDTNTARQDISDIKLQIGTEELTTTSKKIKDAINELSSQIKDNINNINKKLNISDCGYIRPEWSEKWDDNDQTEAFKDCINIITDEFKTKGYSKLHIKIRGNYKISSTLKLNSFVKIVTDSTTKIKYTGTGYLFHIVADDDVLSSLPQVCTSQGNVLDGSNGSLILQGDLSKKQSAIRLGEEVKGTIFRTSLSQTCISHVYIVNFDRAISFSSVQVFINRFFNVSASHCNTILHDEENTVNAGELITWTDCSFHNSNVFLESNGEIFHEFKGCSVDYNKKGIIFNNNKVVTIRFTDCWIEGNAKDDTDYLIQTTNTNHNASVVFSGCQIHFGNYLPKFLNKGKVKVIATDNAIMIDRHNKNYPNAKFLFLFDKDANLVSEKGTFYQYMTSMLSPEKCINRNQYFDENTSGDSVINHYTVQGASINTTESNLFLGTKSIKVDTTTLNYIDIISIPTPLNGAKYVYGNNIFYLSGSNSKTNITLELKFYDSDKTTQIGQTVTMYNDMDYSSYGSGWFNAKWGTGVTPTKVPNGASYVTIRLIMGNLTDKTLYLNGLFLYSYN